MKHTISYGRPESKVGNKKTEISINAVYFVEAGAAHIVLQRGDKVEMITKAISELELMGVFNWSKLGAILPDRLFIDETEEEEKKDA